MRIKYRNSALEDVRGIREYISRDSSSIALKFINKLLDYISYLSLFPELGRPIISEYNIRKLVYQNYIILYQIDYFLNQIHILTVFHSAKNINIILKNIQKFL